MKTPPGHPAANIVETVMKHLGKAMEISNMQILSGQETLSVFLISYRDTSHVSTRVPSAHMFFRDGYRNSLPHHKAPDDKIREVKQTDKEIKRNANPHTAHQEIL